MSRHRPRRRPVPPWRSEEPAKGTRAYRLHPDTEPVNLTDGQAAVVADIFAEVAADFRLAALIDTPPGDAPTFTCLSEEGKFLP